jgi:hypothetical protein
MLCNLFQYYKVIRWVKTIINKLDTHMNYQQHIVILLQQWSCWWATLPWKITRMNAGIIGCLTILHQLQILFCIEGFDKMITFGKTGRNGGRSGCDLSQDTILAFIWRDRGKSWRTVTIVGIPTKICTAHIMNVIWSVKFTRSVKLLTGIQQEINVNTATKTLTV